MKTFRTLLLILLGIWSALVAHAQGASDCVDFVVVCGDGNLSLNSNGTGTNDFLNPNNQPPACGFSETQSLWLRVPIAADGTLEFVISSNNNADDFDFAIYGPNVTCNNLGASIRCSSTNPQAAGTPATTGLRPGENETSDGPGSQGNGFVDPLDVRAGEEYIILIDNFNQTNAGFDLEWGGSAVIAPPPVAGLVPDLEFCDPDGDGDLVVDLFDQTALVVGNQSGVVAQFYLSENDAILDQNSQNSRQVPITNGGQTVYARLTNVSDGCTSITSFEVTINTEPLLDPVTGPASVCPTVTDIPYSVQGTNVDTYEWIVEGGTITSGQGTTDVLVDWGQANDNALLKVIGKTNNGCVSDTAEYAVKINKRLEPEAPRGPVDICFSDRLSTTYEVTAVPGSVYEWGVINGNIVGANDQNSVEINWDGFSGMGRVFFREFNPSISECEGFSDTLDVSLLEEFMVMVDVTQPQCAGTNNGSISISVGGGAVGAVDILWADTGASTDFRDNLAPGTYNYRITDTQGCVATGSVNITEPPPISVDNVTSVDATCFESSDGGLSLSISGGTRGYRYKIGRQFANLPTPLAGNSLEVRNLNRGDYELIIYDENDCEFSMPFTVSSPALLEADLQSLIVTPSCPQSSTGSISLEAIGGTPDYRFTWVPITNQMGNFVTDLAKGDYTVTIVDMNNCRASLTVTVEEVQPRVQVPNAFSPNGDNKNDLFKPISNCPLADYQFTVFNRWGTPIFSTTDLNEGWDGRLDGEAAPIGRYSYKVSYRLPLNDVLIDESVQGVVRVFR